MTDYSTDYVQTLGELRRAECSHMHSRVEHPNYVYVIGCLHRGVHFVTRNLRALLFTSRLELHCLAHYAAAGVWQADRLLCYWVEQRVSIEKV